MKNSKTSLKLLATAFCLSLFANFAIAQDGEDTPPPPPPAQKNNDQNNNGGNRERRRGNFNPEEFKANMMKNIQAQLKATDEEWSVIQPLLDTVFTKQRESQMNRFSGLGSRGRGRPGNNPGGDQTNRPEGNNARGGRGIGPSSPEMDDLRKALESESVSDDEIESKLNALRDTREKLASDLKKACDDLRKVLTLKQEATLVTMGILD